MLDAFYPTCVCVCVCVCLCVSVCVCVSVNTYVCVEQCLTRNVKPILHCDVKPLLLGRRVGLDPQI